MKSRAPFSRDFAWTDETVERMYRLRLQGLSTMDIAKKLGTTTSSVIGKAQRVWGRWPMLPPPPRYRGVHRYGNVNKPWTDADDMTIDSMRAKGFQWDDIAKALGRTKSAVLQRGSIVRKRRDRTLIPLEPWPEDMPRFEDHPKADSDRNGRRLGNMSRGATPRSSLGGE